MSDGTGYVEDGREIFDDDDEEDLPRKSANKSKRSENRKRLRDSSDPVQGKGSIKSLFGNAVPKKKDVGQITDDMKPFMKLFHISDKCQAGG